MRIRRINFLLLTLFLGMSFSVYAQALFNCEKDADCALVDICGSAQSVRADRTEKAVKLLSKKGCAPLTVSKKLKTHKPVCILNKCEMKLKNNNTGKMPACAHASGHLYESCVLEKAAQQKDVSLCQGMKSKDDILECQMIVHMQLKSQKKLTETFCNHIDDKQKHVCLSDLAKQESRPEYCLLFEKKEEMISCLGMPEALAQNEWEKLTPHICKLAQEKELNYWADMCFLHLSKKTQNTAVCENIKSHYPFYLCYRSQALEKGDPELCKMVMTRGAYPKNYDPKFFSEKGCRYFVGHNGSFAGIDEYTQ